MGGEIDELQYASLTESPLKKLIIFIKFTFHLHFRYRLIWAVDILKENFHYVQVPKIWDVVPSSDALEAVKHLELNSVKYTRDEIEKWRARCIRG